ncbi:uncharacterized protein [Miscanthus floridulus]|uniref:uncharacterized protein isoform X2 n=1 Tax=Miscanthus floridulus TaxID=154761 RepID=UPI003459542A
MIPRTRSIASGDRRMRVGDGDGDGGGAHFVFAYYVTGHGSGHATRALEVVRHMLAAGHDVHVVTAAPEFGVTTEIASSRLHIRKVEQVVLDCVAVEPDALTVDRSASLEKAVVPRASILQREAEWLKSIDADVVMLQPWSAGLQVSDVAMGMKGSAESAVASLLSDWEVVRGREETPSPRPPSKRRRGRSLPPASTPVLGARQKRSSSSPPSQDRARRKDKTMASAEVRLTPMAVFWDIENCKVPKDSQVEDISKNIRKALSMNTAVDSATTTIQAYGAVPASIREGLQRTGVRHVDILNRRKDAADKLILVDMFCFAYDNPAPACMLLISGDADFVPAVRMLVERGYTIVIAIPSQGTAASDLTSAGTYTWDWPSLARGEGIVIRRSLPVDVEVLKTEMIQLFKSNGGYIELGHIHSEYTKMFGKQIKLSDYNAPKLVDLFVMLGDPFSVFERKMVLLDMQSDQASTNVTAVGSSELPASLAEDLFVNTEEDPYVPVEDKDVEAVIVGAGSQENEPNERRINKTVFIGKNLNQELEKGFKD